MKLEGVGSSLALPDRVLTFVRDHPLMDEPVHPLENRPLLVQPDTQYCQLAAHRVAALSGQQHHVLYLGTGERLWVGRTALLGGGQQALLERKVAGILPPPLDLSVGSPQRMGTCIRL